MPFQANGRWSPPTESDLRLLERALLSKEFQISIVEGSAIKDLDHSQPVVIRGLIDEWPSRSWTKEKALEQLGDLTFRLRSCSNLHEFGFAGPARRRVTLEDYFGHQGVDFSSSVLFENDFHPAHGAVKGLYQVPKPLVSIQGHPIFSAGRQHTGVGFHRHEENWLAQLLGRKVWFLLPEEAMRPPGLPPWWYLKCPPEGLKCCVVQPGEVIFVPGFWLHSTWNLDEFNLALGWERSAAETWDETMQAIINGEDLPSSLQEGSTSELWELAARSGEMKALEQLLRADPKTLGRNAAPVAISAAHSGQVQVLDFLWENGGRETMLRPHDWWLPKMLPQGSTALHEAATCGQAAALEWLVAKGADSRQPDSMGLLPLHVASLHGQVSVVKMLLAAGAEANGPHAGGRATPLMMASFAGHEHVVEELLACGATVEYQDEIKSTALHQAAFGSRPQACAALLAARASPEAKDLHGRSPLHLAAGALAELKEEDALPPPSTVPYWEAFGLTATDSNLSTVELLLAARADASARDAAQLRPVDYAQAAGHVEVAALLSKLSADL